jgi:hypothetical protein
MHEGFGSGMGMFKQMKQMKDMIHDAPGQVAQGQEIARNAQAMGAAYQAQAAQQMAQATAPVGAAVGGATTGPDFEPVGGVSLELYVEVSKGVAAAGNDQAQAPLLAAAQGVSPSDWETATAAWNARMASNPAVGQRFSALYRGV